MLRKWGTIVLLLLATPMLALAQNTGKLAGRVLDASTGDPLPGANVVIAGTQMGTAADVEGNYFIIGVPVGTYDVQASFVGYTPQTTSGVEVNAGYTRELNFSLSPGTELQEIVVEYERPLIQKDAIGVPKVVTAEDIKNLPVRGVTNVAGLQGGVVQNGNDLHLRGGRDEEVVYYVDGVKINGSAASLGVAQSAIQEQEMLIGGLPAKYGDAMGGVISITTKSGAPNFFGSVEAITSEVLDAYGYNLASASLGGPLVKNKVSFFAAGEFQSMDDRNPTFLAVPQLSESALSQLQSAPQSVTLLGANNTKRFVSFPGTVAPGTTFPIDKDGKLVVQNNTITLSDGTTIPVPDGFTATGIGAFVPTAETFTSDMFERSSAKPNYGEQAMRGNASVTFNPSQAVRVRVGGSMESRDFDSYTHQMSLYASDRMRTSEHDTYRMFGSWTHYLSNSTFYQLQVDYSDFKAFTYDPAFSKDVRDLASYGDIDHPANAIAAQYRVLRSRNEQRINGTDTVTVAVPFFERQYSDGNLPKIGVNSVFALPGASTGRGLTTGYDKFRSEQFRLSANATTQLGLHQLEFGGEFEQRTERRFAMFGDGSQELAQFINDDNGAESGQGVDSYDDLPYNAFKNDHWYYGYNYNGTEEVNDENIADFIAGTNYNVAPYKPIYYAGYIQDKIEYKDVVVNLGVRVDVFDNNTQVLKDPYSLFPITRADAVANRPANIKNDFAVYYTGGNPEAGVAGYRDLEGNFFDAQGQAVAGNQITTILGGKPEVLDRKVTQDVFTDYEPQVTVMPRVGVSFPVTDQALFFAHYDVLSQRPTENAFDTIYEYSLATEGVRTVDNPNLKPQKTIEYELGFRQRLGARAAMTISGFYRQIENLIQLRLVRNVFPNEYTSYQNVDFGTVKGVEFEFDLRRTQNVQMTANYTLSFAQGTGSDAGTTGQIAWRGTFFPNFISPLDFDQRHTFNIVMDYRLGEGEGPMIGGAHLFENFGLNLVANLHSGQPFTKLEGPNPVFNSFILPPEGGVNENNMPWSNRLDLRLDRQFDLGASSLSAFLWVQNVLDTKNVSNVWRATGLASNDGYLDVREGQQFLEREIDPGTAKTHYLARVNNPFFYGLPRTVRMGVRVDF